MKLRYKAPSGGGTLDLDDAATVTQLLQAVKEATGFADVTVKYGWPPQALGSGQADIPLVSLGLQRESLTIIPKEDAPATSTPAATTPHAASAPTFSAPPRPESPKGVGDISVPMPENSSTLGIHLAMAPLSDPRETGAIS
jgi:ubiquitin thioesterase OTU1